MKPDLLCLCAHKASEHDGREPLKPCRHKPCGCGEYRLAVRPAARDKSSDDEDTGEAA